ncbi:MAG: DUF4346 domain-containing protein [Candidatus Zixiibacteriota bacterium]|nr:MAG: DUF4346 domain-containing protein [candidate division Zixibacteria bacterium]
MSNKSVIQAIKSEIENGIQQDKCRKCGCMKELLKNLSGVLPAIHDAESSALMRNVRGWLREMKPIEYPCLGCDHCYPAVVTNILTGEFPSLSQSLSLSCESEEEKEVWPPVAGEYFAFRDDSSRPVAVSTLASVDLAEALADARPEGLCIVGKTETENIGIDKVIKNTVTNPAIRFLLLAGRDPEGHQSGKTLLALCKKGVTSDMRVIGSPAQRPILRNVSSSEVESFRKQVSVIDMVGCADTGRIIGKIEQVSKTATPTRECSEVEPAVTISSVPKVQAREPRKVNMDRAGYFVVIPVPNRKIIVVEHYAYDNKLLHTIQGRDASSLCSTVIENDWLTELSHAAYLGRELSKAELSLKHGFKYVQEGAGGKRIPEKEEDGDEEI